MATKILTAVLMVLWAALAILTPFLDYRWMDIVFTSLNWFIIVSWVFTVISTSVQTRRMKKIGEEE